MALAQLEQLVHIGRENAPDDLVAFAVDIPDDAIKVCDAASLPAYWRTEPPPRQLAQLGDAWVLSGTSLALRVPSAVSPEDANVIINPQHHRFSEVRIGEPFDVVLDPRLLR